VVDGRACYDAGGIRALHDQPRSRRPPEIDEIEVVATLAEDGRPPAHLGVTHWSARLLAAELLISFVTVARIWRKWDRQLWRTETFTFSTDPELDAGIRPVVGLYMHSPEKAVVLFIDEKSGAPQSADEAVRDERPAACHRSDRSKLEADDTASTTTSSQVTGHLSPIHRRR
jgi:hypothetical protein